MAWQPAPALLGADNHEQPTFHGNQIETRTTNRRPHKICCPEPSRHRSWGPGKVPT
jgi:hypothetical protein